VSPVKYEQGFYIPKDGILHSHCRENLKSYSTLQHYFYLSETSKYLHCLSEREIRRDTLHIERDIALVYISPTAILYTQPKRRSILCEIFRPPPFSAITGSRPPHIQISLKEEI
jgi:hypothetical protein